MGEPLIYYGGVWSFIAGIVELENLLLVADICSFMKEGGSLREGLDSGIFTTFQLASKLSVFKIGHDIQFTQERQLLHSISLCQAPLD